MVSIDEKTVTVKTETETRVIDRASIRKIELGDVLMTGMQGREYTNADYLVRVSLPPSWSVTTSTGTDFAARKDRCSFMLRGVPAAEPTLSDADVKGAIAGMKSSVPGSEFTDTADATFSGFAVRRVTFTAPAGTGIALFCVRGRHFLMLLALSESKARSVEACLADWENKIRFVEE